MEKKNLFVLVPPQDGWRPFLEDYFEETNAALHFFHEASRFPSAPRPDVVFLDPALLTVTLTQKLKALRASFPALRVFALASNGTAVSAFDIDGCFPEKNRVDFQKRLFAALPFPDPLEVLVVDDEAEIGQLIRDFLENRQTPGFRVAYAANGKIGLEAIGQKRPHAIVLDLKMPVLDGKGFYAELKRRGDDIPVIVFFDAISVEELEEVRRLGRPAVVDKGSRQSSMLEMTALIQRMVYFG